LQGIDGLYCVGDSCFPGQGVIAVAFSGVMCAHRVAADIGKIVHSIMLQMQKVVSFSKFLLTLTHNVKECYCVVPQNGNSKHL